MKTPRFFILLGACALLFAMIAHSSPMFVRASAAGEIPVVRYDPRAGDPEEPGYWKSIPFDGDSDFARIDVNVELTSRSSDGMLRSSSVHRAWWSTPFRSLALFYRFGR